MRPLMSIWTPDRKKTSSSPRWAKSKNSFDPMNGTPPSRPGSRKRSRGAWLRWARTTPAAGIGELTPIPTRSRSRMARAMAQAMTSSTAYKNQRVYKCRRDHLFVRCQAARRLFLCRVHRVDDVPRGLGHEAIVVHGAYHDVPREVGAAAVQECELGPDGRHQDHAFPRSVRVLDHAKIGTPPQQVAGEQAGDRGERDARRSSLERHEHGRSRGVQHAQRPRFDRTGEIGGEAVLAEVDAARFQRSCAAGGDELLHCEAPGRHSHQVKVATALTDQLLDQRHRIRPAECYARTIGDRRDGFGRGKQFDRHPGQSPTNPPNPDTVEPSLLEGTGR